MPARRRASNPYGFNRDKKGPCANLQLQTLLKLQNNSDVYCQLRLNVINLAAEHLDIDYPPSVQVKAMDEIRAKIKRQYPDIFAREDSEKRLYFLTRVVYQAHTRRRRQIRVDLLANTTPVTPQRKRRQPEDTTPVTPRITRSRASASRSIQELDSGSEYDDNCGIPQSISQGYPRSNERLMWDTPPSPTSGIKYYPIQYLPIHDFLAASVPAMTHLMDPFVDFGCINADFLMAIASWPVERIRYVLDQLPPGHDGRKITEMEKFVLQNHFKDYFM